jgi:hypothetical protein
VHPEVEYLQPDEKNLLLGIENLQLKGERHPNGNPRSPWGFEEVLRRTNRKFLEKHAS